MRRIRYKRLILFLIFVLILGFFVFKLLTLKISNIYVSGNMYLSDQDIIELSKLSNYPRAIFTYSNIIEANINKSSFIESCDVKKRGFSKIYINVVENRPLFYDQISNKTVLKNGDSVSEKYNVPSLVNSVDKSVYSIFLSQLSLIDYSVFNNISEIEYSPNSVDSNLFLFTMNDGNYIYVNLEKFESVNKYFDMVVNFNNHKGILYLDSGEYFKILEN